MSRIIQIFLGFIIGLLALAGASAATGYYFITRLTEIPPKPVFSEELPKTPASPAAKSSPASSPETAKTEEAKPTEQSSPKDPEQLEPGAYKARVTWPEGLSIRDEPNADANKIGGVAYKAELIVIKQSEDGNWQKIRVPSSGQEGWVKAGNVEKIDSDSSSAEESDSSSQ